MGNNSSKFGYVPELDGIRGIAILAVMLFHAGISTFCGGFIGVDIFFVLSGFLITSLLIKEYDRGNHIDFKNFYLRRVLRLLPALVFLLIVYSTLSFIFLSSSEAKSNLIDSFIVLFYGANWARAFEIHGPRFLGHAWSLSIEEQFYILWPITLRYLLQHVKTRKKIFFIVFSLALSSWGLRVFLGLIGTSMNRLYNGLDTRADALLLGCALGIALSSNLIDEKLKEKITNILKYFSPLLFIALVGIILTIKYTDIYYYYFYLLIVEIITVLIILHLFLSNNSVLKIIFANRILVWIGSISYGLYLWHYPIFMSLLSYFGFSHTMILTIGSGITFAITACSFYFLERPFLKLKNRLSSVQKSEKIKKQTDVQLDPLD